LSFASGQAMSPSRSTDAPLVFLIGRGKIAPGLHGASLGTRA
jgi:hypothetical protein